MKWERINNCVLFVYEGMTISIAVGMVTLSNTLSYVGIAYISQLQWLPIHQRRSQEAMTSYLYCSFTPNNLSPALDSG